jgi:hypothetical protein
VQLSELPCYVTVGQYFISSPALRVHDLEACVAPLEERGERVEDVLCGWAAHVIQPVGDVRCPPGTARRGLWPGTSLRVSDEVGLGGGVLCGAARNNSLLLLLDGCLHTLALRRSSMRRPSVSLRWRLHFARSSAPRRSSLGLQIAFNARALQWLFNLAELGKEIDFALRPALAGWPWALALLLFAGLWQGRPCATVVGALGRMASSPNAGSQSCPKVAG